MPRRRGRGADGPCDHGLSRVGVGKHWGLSTPVRQPPSAPSWEGRGKKFLPLASRGRSGGGSIRKHEALEGLRRRRQPLALAVNQEPVTHDRKAAYVKN